MYQDLLPEFRATWDDRGNIGKRYLYQDEIGTPFCVTVDFETLEDQAVTVRNRDTAEQERAWRWASCQTIWNPNNNYVYSIAYV